MASTQRSLRERLEAGEDVDGLVLRASEQTGGVGRRGRAWSAGPGGSYQSLALADPKDVLRTPITALALALALAEELVVAGAGVRVKWPNDVYLGGGKLSGVLAEHVRGHLLVGVGVNVENEVPSGAATLRGWDVERVSELVLDSIRSGVDALSQERMSAFPERYAALDLLAGEVVTLSTAKGEVRGTALGVTAGGALRLRVSGEEVSFTSGSVVSWGLTERA